MRRRASTALLVALCAAAVMAGAWLAIARTTLPPPSGGTWDSADPDLGAKAYVMCQGCHGLEGRGVPGYAPALTSSRWLAGPTLPAVLITLHGFDATNEPGAAYVSARMLGHGHQLADHEVAALLTTLRSRWGDGGVVSPAEVSTARARFSSRTSPWSPAELRALSR